MRTTTLLLGGAAVLVASPVAAIMPPEASSLSVSMAYIHKNSKPYELVNSMAGKANGEHKGQAAAKLPVVMMHGMGDAGNNSGMHSLCEEMAKKYDVYVVCLDVADGFSSITTRMEEQLKALTKVIQADEKLKNGFNALGNSQGGLLMRSYLEKVNDPPVRRFVSVCGTQNGIATCPKSMSWICPVWKHFLNPYDSPLVFSDYWKDPSSEKDYVEKSPFLADLNNEKPAKNDQYKQNMANLEAYVTVEATADTMVYPHESENHGFYKWGTQVVEKLRDTQAYKEDWLGLKTLDDGKRLKHLTFEGEHLQVPGSMWSNDLFPVLAGEGFTNQDVHYSAEEQKWTAETQMSQTMRGSIESQTTTESEIFQ